MTAWMVVLVIALAGGALLVLGRWAGATSRHQWSSPR